LPRCRHHADRCLSHAPRPHPARPSGRAGIVTALQVRGLRVSFDGTAVVDGVDIEVAPGECLAIVGESGAGKSLAARATLGLAPERAEVAAQELLVDGVDARALSERAWRRLRGARIALVSQDALVSLDPLRRIGSE